MASGLLYLIPTSLADSAAEATTSPQARELIARLEVFIVEQAKSARRFLANFPLAKPLAELEFHLLNEHTAAAALPELLAPLSAGRDVGLLSEAGCPAVADPGASLVRFAHRAGIRVSPLVGPSSILLALMASGLNGQRFRFHGYLPIERGARVAAIRALEAEARSGETQIFIETPYRNLALLKELCATCAADTLLCIASDMTALTERIRLCSIAAWARSGKTDLDRRPSVFLLGRE